MTALTALLLAQIVLFPLTVLGAVAVVGATVSRRRERRGGTDPVLDPPADVAPVVDRLVVSRSEAHAAELGELRRTVARQRTVLEEAARMLATAGLTTRIDHLEVN